MDEITRVKTLNEAFNAVQRRVPFLYQHSSWHALYQPLDSQYARLIIANLHRYPQPNEYADAMSEMAIFASHVQPKRFEYNGLKCLQFDLKRVKLQ
jgi:hypothetical protein